MADLGPLQTLYSWLGGMQQPPTQLGVGGQQQAPTPAATPGLFDMLSTPGAQGILASYLGYLSRPRGLNTNRWQGIGLGGLAGLNAMEQARSQQLQAPLRQAELQKATLETQNLQQTMQNRQEMLKQFDANPQMQQLAKTNPMAHMLARNGIITGKMDAAALGIQKPMSQFETERLKQLGSAQQSLQQYRTGQQALERERVSSEESARQQQLGIEGARLGLERTRVGSEESLIPLRQEQIRASIDAAKARAQALSAAGKPLSDKDIESLSQSAGKAAIAGMKASWTETEKGFETRKNQAYQDAYNGSKQELRKQRQGAVINLATSPESLGEGETEAPLTP